MFAFPAPCVTIILCRGGCAEAVSKNNSIPFTTSGDFNEFSRVLNIICFIVSFPSVLFSVAPLTSLLNAKLIVIIIQVYLNLPTSSHLIKYFLSLNLVLS